VDSGYIKEDDCESIEVAKQCLSECFRVDPGNDDDRAKYGIQPLTLSAVFDTFLKTKTKVASAPAKHAQAEEHKTRGNQCMTAKDYDQAVACYTQAIQLDGANAVYYANRAAAHSQNSQNEQAANDARKAIELDPKYAKAYSRLGLALFALEKYKEAESAYQTALSLEPHNVSFKETLQTIQQRLDNTRASSTSPKSSSSGSGPAPALNPADLLGGAGGAAGLDPSMLDSMNLGSLLSNPAIQQMASQLMSNPDMVSSLMNNPMLSQLMGQRNPSSRPDTGNTGNTGGSPEPDMQDP